MIGRQKRSSSTADGGVHRHSQGLSQSVGYGGQAGWFNVALQALLEERELWVLWLPVGFGLVIALYFALPFEPSLWTIPLLSLPALAMTMFIQRQAVLQDGFSVSVLSLITMLLMLIGFGAAQLRHAGRPKDAARQRRSGTVARPRWFPKENSSRDTRRSTMDALIRSFCFLIVKLEQAVKGSCDSLEK